MQKRKILVVGPSLSATFMKFLSEDTSNTEVSFDVFAISGSAFLSPDLIVAEGGNLVFKDVFSSGSQHSWNSNIGLQKSVNLSGYSAVFYLDPLFILGGFMREVLFRQLKGICPHFLKGAEGYFKPDEIYSQLGRYRPISTTQWLAIYQEWRVGTINALASMREIDKDIPIFLLPPASPPPRLRAGVYSYYNLKEQLFIGEHLASRFGVKFCLQPREMLDARLATPEELHAPAPDPHHPMPEFYRMLIEKIDFQTLDFRGGFQSNWLQT